MILRKGGVLNRFWEQAEASGRGIEIWPDRIPIADETRELCSTLRLDPLKLMSSGCLMIAADPSVVGRVTSVLGKLGIRVSEVGRLTQRSKGRFLVRGSEKKDLVAVFQDRIYKLA